MHAKCTVQFIRLIKLIVVRMVTSTDLKAVPYSGVVLPAAS